MTTLLLPKSVTVFIPARGGSKGIPAKNLQIVRDVPLVQQAVEVALGLRHSISNVTIVVSTEDEEIRKVAESAGAKIHDRLPEHSGDSSPTEAALSDYLERHSDIPTDEVIVLMQCTSPSTTVDNLMDGIKQVCGPFDSSFIGVENHHWLYREVDGYFQPVGHHLGHRPSRQKVEPTVHETGAAYFFSKSGFERNQFRLHGKIGCVKVDMLGYIDIDEPSDLDLARKVLGRKNRTNHANSL